MVRNYAKRTTREKIHQIAQDQSALQSSKGKGETASYLLSDDNYVQISIGDRLYKALIDTGADKCIIGREVFENIKNSNVKFDVFETFSYCVFAGGEMVPADCEAMVDVYLDTNCYSQTFMVVPHLEAKIILGRDFLRNNKMIVDYTGEVPQIHKASQLILQQSIVMPPNSEAWVKTTVNSSQNIENMEGIINTGTVSKRKRLLLMKALVRVESGTVYTRILNTTSSIRKLECGEKVGYLSDLKSPTKINLSKSQKEGKYEFSCSNAKSKISQNMSGHFTPEVDYSESNITEPQKAEMNEVLTRNCNAFVGPDGNLGRTNLYEHEIDLIPGAKPIQRLPYRMAPEARDRLERCVQDQLHKGVIEETDTGPWASPGFLVKKADGGDRLVCDYRGLNKETIDQFLNVPRVEDTIDAVGCVKPKYITLMDLQQAFHQIPIREEDCDKTAFITPSGKYRYKVISMGLKNAARSCQLVLDMVMRGIQFKSCLVYIDDVVIYGKEWDQHLKDVEDVLQRLIKAGLKLKRSKTKVACQETLFLGHMIGEYGIKPNPNKVKAIRDMQAPKDLTSLRRILGMTGFFRRFIPNYGKIAFPLYGLIKDGVEWEWTDSCQKAFEALRDALTSDSTLLYPDFAKKFFVTTDASGTGIGAELSQLDEKGIERPVAFLSKKFQKCQNNYSTLDKELLGICYAVEYWDVYLKGRKFLIRTDHSALKYILGDSAKFTLRQSKWRAFLNQYDFDIEHIKGKSNVVADALSRLDHDDEDQIIAPGVEDFIEKCLEINQVIHSEENRNF